MKDINNFISPFILGLLVLLVFLQFRQMSNLRQSEKEDFLPMVYENQVYQASILEGLDVISSAFRIELIKRKVTDCPILVFHYSGLSCKGCVQSCLNELRRQCPDFEKNQRILVVVSDKGSNRVPSNSFVLEEGDSLGYDFEGTNIPHFFIYDGQIKHVFIPDQTDSNALTIYLSTILGRYGI